MKATAVLPAEYEQRGTLDLSQNRLLAVGMTVLAAGLLVFFTWLLLGFLALTRPELGSFGFTAGALDLLPSLAFIGLLTAVMVLIHEALHGLGFWAFTGQRPVFGLRGLYAFAGAPGWYLPRDRYVLVGLAPLVVITIVGLALMLVIPGWLVMAVVFVVAFNGAGAVGDLAAVSWMLTQQRATLVRDTGDVVTVYQPVALGQGRTSPAIAAEAGIAPRFHSDQ